MEIKDLSRCLLVMALLVFDTSFSATGVLDFSSRSSSLALTSGSRVRLKYTNNGNQFGWEHASIVKSTGDTPQNWKENYSDGAVITYDDAPWPDFDLTYTLSLFVVQNSNAIVHVASLSSDLIVQNSNAIVNNSNAIVHSASLGSDLIIQNSNVIVNCCSKVFSNPLTSNIVLDSSYFIGPNDQIIIGDDLTIDGQGAVLYFAGKNKPVGPQFVVSPGKTVTLNNIRLVGIASDTFSLMSDDAKIVIGENVVWGLDENVTFTRGKIQISGQNVFNIGGCCGQKRLILDPVTGNSPMVDIGLSTLALQNIELTGLEHISHSVVGNLTGALGLVGNASVNVERDNSMSFYIESLGNVFRILENNLTFGGILNYSATGDNALHIDFVLRSPVDTLDAREQLKKGKVPVINFATDFIYLTSESGMARLIFDDFIVKVNNEANAFVVLENSFLGANKLQVAGDPIWDASADDAKNRFAVEAIELEAVGPTSEELPEFGIPIIVDPGHHL